MRDTVGFDGVKPSRQPPSVVRFAGLVFDFDACSAGPQVWRPNPSHAGRVRCTEDVRRQASDGLLAATLCWTPSPTGASSRSTAASTCWSGGLRKKIEADPKQSASDRHRARRRLPLRRADSRPYRPSQSFPTLCKRHQDDEGRQDSKPDSGPSMAELPATFGATGGAIAPMPERRETPPTARHALEGARPPAETTPSRAEPSHVTALAAEPVQVKEAGFAALKKLSALATVGHGHRRIAGPDRRADGGLSMRTTLRLSLRMRRPKPARLSIVVLPFTNLSTDPAQRLFRRRRYRESHHRTVAPPQQFRHRPQHRLHL